MKGAIPDCVNETGVEVTPLGTISKQKTISKRGEAVFILAVRAEKVLLQMMGRHRTYNI